MQLKPRQGQGQVILRKRDPRPTRRELNQRITEEEMSDTSEKTPDRLPTYQERQKTRKRGRDPPPRSRKKGTGGSESRIHGGREPLVPIKQKTGLQAERQPPTRTKKKYQTVSLRPKVTRPRPMGCLNKQ